jgi:hypothetical protein
LLLIFNLFALLLFLKVCKLCTWFFVILYCNILQTVLYFFTIIAAKQMYFFSGLFHWKIWGTLLEKNIIWGGCQKYSNLSVVLKYFPNLSGGGYKRVKTNHFYNNMLGLLGEWDGAGNNFQAHPHLLKWNNPKIIIIILVSWANLWRCSRTAIYVYSKKS